jgi:PKD repeat protein
VQFLLMSHKTRRHFMKSLISKYLMVPATVLLLTLTGCGSGGDQQQGAAATAGSSPVTMTAQDVAMTTAIENAVASLDANAPAIAAAKSAALATANPAASTAAKAVPPAAPVAGEKKVFGKSIFVVPKSGTISVSKTFNGLVDGAQGTLVFYNSFGENIPTTACTGTAKQIKICQASRSIALAWNPTSVDVVLNGATVITPTLIPRTQGKAQFPVAVNKTNTLQVTLAGPAYSFIQLEVWSQPTAPVVANPIANFTFNPTTGTVPVNIAFDASTSTSPNGPIMSYAWDFGDGGTGSGMTTSHVYGFAGTFSIVLTVTDSVGKSATKSAQIVIAPPILPVASFTYTIDTSTGALIVAADGSGSSSANGPIISYNWNWGDGIGVSSGVTSSYTYALPGTYVVTLVVLDISGNVAVISQTVVVP